MKKAIRIWSSVYLLIVFSYIPSSFGSEYSTEEESSLYVKSLFNGNEQLQPKVQVIISSNIENKKISFKKIFNLEHQQIKQVITPENEITISVIFFPLKKKEDDEQPTSATGHSPRETSQGNASPRESTLRHEGDEQSTSPTGRSPRETSQGNASPRESTSPHEGDEQSTSATGHSPRETSQESKHFPQPLSDQECFTRYQRVPSPRKSLSPRKGSNHLCQEWTVERYTINLLTVDKKDKDHLEKQLRLEISEVPFKQ